MTDFFARLHLEKPGLASYKHQDRKSTNIVMCQKIFYKMFKSEIGDVLL